MGQLLSDDLVSGYLLSSYLPRTGVNTGDIDAGNELNGRRAVGIIRSTVDVHTVYPVLMDALTAD